MRAFVFILLFAVVPLHARDVYKCVSPAGGVAFQDHSCASGDTETLMHVNASAGMGAGAAPAADDAGGVTAPAPKPVPRDVAPTQRPAPPTMWLCTRPEDGTQYMSHDGNAPTRMVPAGVLGMPNQSLGTAYGKGGIGVSAPGVRKIPVDTSAQSAIAGDYVAIQDQCAQATPEGVCSYLEDRAGQIRQKLHRAFKDEQAVLQPELDQIESQLDGC